MFVLALKRRVSSKLAAGEQRLKKSVDARMSHEALVEHRSSFTSCVSCFG
jgi:hypothetical protein